MDFLLLTSMVNVFFSCGFRCHPRLFIGERTGTHEANSTLIHASPAEHISALGTVIGTGHARAPATLDVLAGRRFGGGRCGHTA